MSLSLTTRVLVLAALAATLAVSMIWGAPCSSPILWRVGEIDQRFGLTADALRETMELAEAVWESPTGLDLFQYDEVRGFPINFLYDARQMTAQDNAQRRQEIEDGSESADELRRRYESASSRYESAKKDFLKLQSSHQARVDAYNQRVASWNRTGGPSAAFDDIERERKDIEKEAKVLEAGRVATNELAVKANKLSDRYNDQARAINENIDAINATAGHEFKQARYVQSFRETKIDVFEFLSRADLVHVLAHELGHALGLGHNQNEQAIMYGMNSSETAMLAPEDFAAVKEVCRF